MNLQAVPELYRGPWDEDEVRKLRIDTDSREGYVVRIVEPFSFEDFRVSIAKWVRAGHVQSDEHWMHAPIVPNRLADVS